MVNYILFETALGYTLFERLQSEEIGAKLEQVQKSVEDLVKFGKTVRFKSFLPFKNAVKALENANDISEGIVSDNLKEFLSINLPAPSANLVLGVSDKSLAGSIKSELGYECETSDLVLELVRGIRLHSDKMLNLKGNDLEKAQLGLGHSYSRAKVKFNVNRADNMIIQAISLLDQLDKDVNTFAMRVREWYSWHFPELVKIINDNYQYSKLAKFIKNKSELTEEQIEGLIEITGDESKARQILDAAKASMGTDISETDMDNIERFTSRVIALADYRKQIYEYLLSKMHNVAPNLSALIGEVVGARLISHAGSLTNLSKYPASTVQILGAEKALFRALKTKGNTPKHGLLYQSSFIGRAGAKNKGKISRCLANKCTIASRIDCFTEKPTSKFGEALKGQVEERLNFYENGTALSKNLEVITNVIKELEEEESAMDIDEESSKKEGKRKASPEPQEAQPKKHKGDLNAEKVDDEESTKKKKSKKKDKSNKYKLLLPSDLKEKKDKKGDEGTPKSDKKKKDKKEESTLQESPKSDKKKDKKVKEAASIEETPKPDKEKKDKKNEETLAQETPKSDKKKRDKKVKEATPAEETPKSDKKKKDKKGKKEELMITDETPKSSKKKDKKNKETTKKE